MYVLMSEIDDKQDRNCTKDPWQGGGMAHSFHIGQHQTDYFEFEAWPIFHSEGSMLSVPMQHITYLPNNSALSTVPSPSAVA